MEALSCGGGATLSMDSSFCELQSRNRHRGIVKRQFEKAHQLNALHIDRWGYSAEYFSGVGHRFQGRNPSLIYSRVISYGAAAANRYDASDSHVLHGVR